MSWRERLAAVGASLVACALPAIAAAGGLSDGTPGPTNGIKANVSYSTWVVTGNDVMLRFLLPAREAERLVGRAPSVVTTSRLGEYLLSHTAVTAAGQNCPAQDQGYDIGRVDPLAVGTGLYGFEILFRCANPTSLALEDLAGFDRVPEHVNFARIEIRGRSFQRLFTASHQRMTVPDSGAMPSARPGAYFPLGVRHVLRRLDLWCFLLGSLLLLRRGRELQALVAALVAGYGMSVVTALSGGITLRASLADASVGFWVAFLAARQMTRALKRPEAAAAGAALLLFALAAVAAILHCGDGALLLAGMALVASGLLLLSARASDHVLVASLPAFMVGLLDGHTLPGALTPAALPDGARLPMLVGFDTGALVAEVALLLVPVALYLALKDRREVLQSALVADFAAMVLGGLGVLWLISGAYSLI